MTAHKIGQWSTNDPSWHEARRTRIGGSEIGALMGWSPFQTPQQLLASKLGATPDRNTPAMRRGRYLEPAIAAWYAGEHDVEYDAEYQGTWVAENDWQLYNPDAVTTEGVLCEFKTTSVRDSEHGWGRAGGSKVPLAYAAQVQWGLGVLGLPEAVLVVLAGAPKFDFAVYRMRFQPESFAYLTQRADQFRARIPERTTAA
jgi:putative phage-type endonuclease